MNTPAVVLCPDWTILNIQWLSYDRWPQAPLAFIYLLLLWLVVTQKSLYIAWRLQFDLRVLCRRLLSSVSEICSCPVFELLGGWVGSTPNCFFFNPFNTLSNYALGVSYLLYTQDLHRNFGWALTVEKFNPQLIFYNSNTAAVCQKIATPLCSPTILTHKAADQIMGVGIFCFFRRK